MTVEERGFLAALKQNARDAATRLAYADWLEDQGRPLDALQQRAKAGVSQVRYSIRRKSDGLISDAAGGWGVVGRQWVKLGDVRLHLLYRSRQDKYNGDTEWADVEIILSEIRVHPAAVISVEMGATPDLGYRDVKLGEPKPTRGA
jgi:uncharacterized protein (TIGR02996 family)